MDKNRLAQNIARETIRDLHTIIQVGMSEKEIEQIATDLLIQKGSNSWWYYGLGAFVLLGRRSIESMSGPQYHADENNRVGATDVITIDLAPAVDGFWGDYARTLFMEDGVMAREDQPRTPLFRQGLDAELHLHNLLLETAAPEMTYEELYLQMNAVIIQSGFENLDFHGNLGHSVEMDKNDRVYIELGNRRSFEDVGKPFTFEPHIRIKNGTVGFKREDIYYFGADRRLRRL